MKSDDRYFVTLQRMIDYIKNTQNLPATVWHVCRHLAAYEGPVLATSRVQCQDALGLEPGKKLLFCTFECKILHFQV